MACFIEKRGAIALKTHEEAGGRNMKNPLESLQNTILLGIAITIVMALIVKYTF
jgi:hypothetical protein